MVISKDTKKSPRQDKVAIRFINVNNMMKMEIKGKKRRVRVATVKNKK